MVFASGTKLGPYEIISPLGVGGMGEVYRARDIRLKREVALKILPEAFARDPDRMQRLQREAQLLAALNHPNIAAIYGLEEGALILELVEGETLPRPLPIDTALRYARQIAEAMEYAHERGVIHRDLKPANIKVTSEGIVKLLDFGLAKAVESPDAAGGDPEISPTLTLELTRVGVIMGTAAYMSPEQAGGKVADRRADIWSFGAVLYEILSGQRAFAGESVPDTLANVLKVDPDWNALPASTPLPIRNLVRRCLTKDRKQRLQAIGEARIAIEYALRGVPMGETPVPAAGLRRRILPWAIAGVVAVVGITASLIAWRSTRPVDHPLLRFNVDLGPDAMAGPNVPALFSPDGTTLVFPARGPDGKQQLATRMLDRPQTTFLAGTEGAFDPFFSPDGEWIGYFGDGKMKKVPVRGGTVVTLCNAPEGRGAAWGDDGYIIATLDSQPATGISRISAAGGIPQAITQPGAKGEATHRWPQILPGNQAVLFTGNKTASNYDDSSIEVLSLKTGQTKVVQPGGYFGRYLPGGYLVYVQHGSLFGVALDLDRLEVRGTPVLLQEDVAGNTATAGGQFAFSAQGTFVYASGKSSSGTWTLVWVDSAGQSEPLRAVPEIYYQPRFSPDGKQVAFSSNSAIKIYDRVRDTLMQITFTTQTNTILSPVWTPDGKHIVFESQGTTSFSLQWIRADGSGEAQLLLERKNESVPRSFSPDGRRLAFEDRSTDIWTLPLDVGDPERPKPGQPELFLRTASGEHQSAFSPDGRWIAYSSTESGRNEVYVRPFPSGASSGSGKSLVSTGGSGPLWSRTGNQLFYVGPDDRIMNLAYTVNGDIFAASKPHIWSNMQISGALDLAPDGKRFVEARPRADVAGGPKTSVHVTVLLNFFDEVRRRVLARK